MIKNLFKNVMQWVKSKREIDISSAFTYKLESGTGTINATYEPLSGKVEGTLSVFNATAFSTSSHIYEFPTQYCPKVGVAFPMVIINSAGANTYRGAVSANGFIVQSLTSNATAVYGHFVYFIGGVILNLLNALSGRRCVA